MLKSIRARGDDGALEYQSLDTHSPSSPNAPMNLAEASWSKRHPVLTLLLQTVFALVSLAALAVLVAMYDRSTGHSVSGSSGSGSGTTAVTSVDCQSPNFDKQALVRAGDMLDWMDSTLDPCEDYFRYSCQGFLDKNYLLPLETGQAFLLDEMEVNRQNLMARILEGDFNFSALFAKDPSSKRVLGSIQIFYDSCTTAPLVFDPEDESSMEARVNLLVRVAETIRQEVHAKIITLSPEHPEFLETLQSTIILASPNSVAQIRDLPPEIFPTWLFDVMIVEQYRPKYQGAIALMPQSGGIDATFTSAEDRMLYEFALSAILKIYIYQETPFEQVATMVGQLVDLEVKYTQILKANRKPDTWYYDEVKAWSLPQLKASFPHLMQNWAQFFTNLRLSPDVVNHESFRVYLYSEEFFVALNSLFGETPRAVLQNYGVLMEFFQLAGHAQLQLVELPYVQFIPPPTPEESQQPDGALPQRVKKRTWAHRERRAQHKKHSMRWDYAKASTATHLKSVSDLGAWLKATDSDTLTELLGRAPNKESSVLTQTMTDVCMYLTQEKFQAALGRFFAHAALNDNLEVIKNMVTDIKDSYHVRIALQDYEWLDDASAQLAKEKLDAMTMLVGYPEEFQRIPGGNRSSFTEEFYGFRDRNVFKVDDYFTNSFLAGTRLNEIGFEYVNKMDLDRLVLSLFVDWSEVNAFYVPMMNTLVFPMGFMLRPLYSNLGNTLAMTYGSLGSIMGHEISHSFDNNGINFNKYGELLVDDKGNPVSMLNQSSWDEYALRTQCFTDYFSKNVRIKTGSLIDGKQTLGENIADNGGLKAAWDAYQKAKGKRAGSTCPNPYLRGVSEDRSFWLAYSQMWCANMDPDVEESYRASDEHTVLTVRVNAAVSLVDEFAQTYQCKTGSRMNPEQECHLWRR